MVNQIGVYLFLFPIVYIVYEYYTTTTLGDLVRREEFQGMGEKVKAQLISQILHCLLFIENAEIYEETGESRKFAMVYIDPDNILVLQSKVN